MEEGLIEEARFVPMFGIFGMAEAVNLLMEKGGLPWRYGHDDEANQLGYRISARLSEWVARRARPMPGAAVPPLHAQGTQRGQGRDPGVRIPMARSRIPPVTCWPWRPTTAFITPGSARS